eukprot:1155278-Pelagomonas_calceolata.AAC.3
MGECMGKSKIRPRLEPCMGLTWGLMNSVDLTELRTQFQHLFSSAPPSSASRLKDFMNQDDVLGLA